MAEAARKMRGTSDAAKSYTAQMEAVGFVNVNETVYKWPSNRWPKEKKYKELGELSPQDDLGGTEEYLWLIVWPARDVGT
jgi:hypothetical protein